MKTISAAAVVIAMSARLLVGAPMTQRDRENLVSHLQMTESWLVDEVSGLSPAQLNFRMAPGKWTVAEVVEHLVIADPTYWELFQDGMKQPPKHLEKQATDADVLWYGINRTEHQKTEPRKDPKGQAIDIRPALDSFRKLHSMMLDYARTTDQIFAAILFRIGALMPISVCSKFQRIHKGIFCRSARSKPIRDFRNSDRQRTISVFQAGRGESSFQLRLRRLRDPRTRVRNRAETKFCLPRANSRRSSNPLRGDRLLRVSCGLTD
jgi:hypothetical protein